MFEITLNGQTLYHPNSEDCIILSAVLHESLNDAGYMELGVPFNNPLYDDLQERQSEIVVYKDNNAIWYGQIRDISVDFNKTKTAYVVGEAGYLNNTVQPQREIKNTKRGVLEAFISQHNAMSETSKRFYVGIVGANATKQIRVVTDWEYTLDAIRKYICEEEEYFRIRHIDDKRYIDIMPLDNYGKRSEQTIMFGDNLLDYAEESSGEGIATACIPLGSKIEESKIEGYDNYLTCEAANGGKNYVSIPAAVNTMGWITKVVHFNVLNTPEALVTAGMNYLKSAQYAKLSLKLSAVDLSILEADIDGYSVGDYVRALCEPMGMDAWLPIRSKDTDILNLANNVITVGSEITKTFTEKQSENYEQLEELMPNKDSILEQAKKNASAIINGAGKNGYVVMHQNEKGVVTEILIMDTPDIDTAKKVWRWNDGGFGYSKTGYNGTYGTAITMDGAIVADYITSGKMSANYIKGGTLEVGGNGYAKDGVITVKNAQNKALVTLDKNGMTLDPTVKISYTNNLSDTPTIPKDIGDLSDNNSKLWNTTIASNWIQTNDIYSKRLVAGAIRNDADINKATFSVDTSGNIKGATIKGSTFQNNEGTFKVESNGNINGATIKGSSFETNNKKFSVTTDGYMKAESGQIANFNIGTDRLTVGDAAVSQNVMGCGAAGYGLVNIVGNTQGEGVYGYIQLSNSGNPSQCLGGIRIYGNGHIVKYNEYGQQDWDRWLSNIPTG